MGDHDESSESIFARDSDSDNPDMSQPQNYARETSHEEPKSFSNKEYSDLSQPQSQSTNQSESQNQSQNYARETDPEESEDSQSQTTYDTKYESLVNEKKFVVFESSLNQLFVRCQKCGELNVNQEETIKGAALTVTTECTKGCSVSWSSSPKLGKGHKSSFTINILMSTILLTAGASFTSVNRVFNHLRIPFVSQQLYNNHCNRFIYPVVWFIWIKHQEALLASLQSLGSGIEMAGDGRFDSPGFTAAICVYFMLCLNVNKVAAFSVTHKSQTTSSSLMEPLGLMTCLHRVTSAGVEIARLATDRCSNIKDMMEKRFEMIEQQYDPWHWIKNVMKDLKKASKTTKGKPLAPWLKSINNMLWYSFANCKKDPIRLQEMIMSIVGHCANRHNFEKFTVFKQCLHGPLKEHSIPWLIPGEYPAQKLIEILKGKDGSRFLALEKMAHGMNTFMIESLNNKALVWAPKRLHYPPKAMLIRSALTAMEFNENSDRGQATTLDGTPRYNIVAQRGGMTYTAKPIKNDNTHATLDVIRSLVLHCKDLDWAPDVTYPLPEYPKNTAKVDKPSKAEAIEKHKSRFKQKT